MGWRRQNNGPILIGNLRSSEQCKESGQRAQEFLHSKWLGTSHVMDIRLVKFMSNSTDSLRRTDHSPQPVGRRV
jgi:hypothetical protein